MIRVVRTAGGTALGTLLLAGAAAPPAPAAYGPGAQIASATATQIGDAASGPASISADGRFVVFVTGARNLYGTPETPGQLRVGGVFRKDLATGALELVAPAGRRTTDGTELSPSPTLAPVSVSADGRYVAFTTRAQLTGGDANAFDDVYVRDMARPVSAANAYELVSAIDGTALAPAYDAVNTVLIGSTLSGPRTISNDGRKVLFATRSASSLPGGGAPVTPRLQLLVRDLDRRTTTLVTRRRDDASAAGAAVPPSPRGFLPLAALSGDGTTAVWAGGSAAEQTVLAAGESTDRDLLTYLWRDLTAGPSAATRRVTGPVDPDGPGCDLAAYRFDPTGPGTGSPACDGPFRGPETLNPAVPQSSARVPAVDRDGTTVAFTAGGALRAYPAARQRARDDVFVAEIRTGATRTAALAELTYGGSDAPGIQNGPLDAPAISADGRRVAFAARRSAFVLPEPRPIGAFPGGGQPVGVFAVDLAARTVETVTFDQDGTDTSSAIPLDEGSGGVTLSGDGSRVAFSADDGGFIIGDGNDVRDVFVAGPSVEKGGPAPVRRPAPPQPPGALAEADATVDLHAVIGPVRLDRHGVARVTVRVPAAGNVRATATAKTTVKRRTRTVKVGTARRTAEAQGAVSVAVAPSSAARAARRSRALKVALRITYAPARRLAQDGARARPATVTRRYTLTRATRKKGARR